MVLEFKVTRIHKFDGDGATKAFCDVTICDELLVKGLRVVNGKKGLFVSMPRVQAKDGKWYDNMLALTDETKKSLSEAVLAAYEDNSY